MIVIPAKLGNQNFSHKITLVDRNIEGCKFETPPKYELDSLEFT